MIYVKWHGLCRTERSLSFFELFDVMLIRRRESLAKYGYREAHIFAYACLDMADYLLMDICALIFLFIAPAVVVFAVVPVALVRLSVLFSFAHVFERTRTIPKLPTGCTIYSVLRGLYLVLNPVTVDVYADYFIEKHAELISYKYGRFRTEVLSYYFCALWLFRECFDLILTLIISPIKSVRSWMLRDL